MLLYFVMFLKGLPSLKSHHEVAFHGDSQYPADLSC